MPFDKAKLDKLVSQKSTRIGGKGTMRRKPQPNRKRVSEDLLFWKVANKLDIYTVPDIKQIILVNDDKSTIEINEPSIKTVNKGNTTVIYKGDKTTIKYNSATSNADEEKEPNKSEPNKLEQEPNESEQEPNESELEPDPEPKELEPKESEQESKKRNINRTEKKIKKALSKINMVAVPNISKAIIKSKNLDFCVNNPEVYKLEKSLLYIVYGEQQVENLLERLSANNVNQENGEEVENLLERLSTNNVNEDVSQEDVGQEEISSV